MPLVNWKVESKLKWTKHFVFSAVGNDKTNDNRDNIIFPIKRQWKTIKLFSKWFERSIYWNEFKTQSKNNNTTNKFRYFLKSNFVGDNKLFVLV